jgi:hypothetical protein
MHTQKIEKVTVQRLVQWSTCAPVIGRLEENNSYQRKTQVCFGSAEFASQYVLKILHGNDDEIITLNMKENKAYIIDGAQRINTLVKFQQGLIPLVVPWGELPDNVACTGYGEPDDKYVKEQFHPDPEKMVQAYYSQMTPTVQNRFMQSTVNVVKIEDLSNEKERVMHCKLNELSEWGVSAVKTAEKEVQTSDDISLDHF